MKIVESPEEKWKRFTIALLHPRCLTVLLVAIGVCILWAPLRPVFEVLCYVTLLLVAYRSKHVREYFSHLSLWQRNWLLGLLVALVVVQVANIPRKTFPFVNWNMYSKQVEIPNRCYTLSVKRADGSLVRMLRCPFRPSMIMPASRLKTLLDSRTKVAPNKREALEKRIEQLEQMVVQRYAVDYPDQQAVALILNEGTFALDRVNEKEPVTWMPYYESPVSK